MYFLTGPTESVKTVLLLCTRYREGGAAPREEGGSGAHALRRAYHGYLRSLGGEYPDLDDAGVRLVDGDREVAALAATFGLPSTPPSPGRPPNLDRWERILFREGLERLDALDSELAEVFDLVVPAVFSTPAAETPGSMTTATLPGIVWVSPTTAWSAEEIAEAYLHELTHTLLTLDEHRYGHYADYEALSKSDNLCVSAIRRERRPLNAVAHSAMVAYELLRLRRLSPENGGVQLHAPSEELYQRALASYESVVALPNLSELCTPRMTELIAALGTGLREESVSLA
jgi:HEXXH motif-containing protein